MMKIASCEFEKLSKTDGYPLTLGELQTNFPVRNVARKALMIVESGMLVRLKRNLVSASPQVVGHSLDKHMLANRICTLSYVSRESALSHYGMIPEMVVNVDLRLDVMNMKFDASVFGELIAVGRKRRLVELAQEVLCHA